MFTNVHMYIHTIAGIYSVISPVLFEHVNDFVFYSAVEPDSLIAVLWHFLSFLSFGGL